jgi:hypothetical protein
MPALWITASTGPSRLIGHRPALVEIRQITDDAVAGRELR